MLRYVEASYMLLLIIYGVDTAQECGVPERLSR